MSACVDYLHNITLKDEFLSASVLYSLSASKDNCLSACTSAASTMMPVNLGGLQADCLTALTTLNNVNLKDEFLSASVLYSLSASKDDCLSTCTSAASTMIACKS